ncbi:pyridine nucleotide-disulfide oxidoreductase [Tenacibaculum holothuriorum]|uniref:Pyridine nucleotide-disulfide oxidoreductase n=1 Tax=Tenacibaculum holothuriorum TaxID=1635173 RepID=A0A1Y2PCW9_9FLAO|nr:ArsO family NAD(P)H-dependent flavin-containing monooxygenase [Tenacibaculum holothuriorum]OSY88302.1 pyridine nucleotide-disulfide oxidoreductase [Tenacibaculum holothuriorum]
MKIYDTLIIGGGQAGLSMAYFLRRKKLDYLVLDNQSKPGGSWLHTWDSLKLFSPTEYSSLSGWMMPKSEHEYPTKNEFISYLEQYEQRYNFPVQRNTEVLSVHKEQEIFKIITNQGVFYTKTLVSATGTAHEPFIPDYSNREEFEGEQLHSVNYRDSNELSRKKVLIVGGGNSGAQILAEVSKVANTQWVTIEEPHFLPDDIDGRYLFNQATQKFLGKSTEQPSKRKVSLSSIVMVESVKEARERKVLQAKRPFQSFYKQGVVWKDGIQESFDVVIWCTGFKANLEHLEPLHITENNRIATQDTRSIEVPGLWLVGYGSWTGFASATIYGVGKTARQTANEIEEFLS